MVNRLGGETSPYLLQHSRNPVDWYPWGAEALERARREDRPIFLSIGYAACHWCHVMERESFEDEAIAALVNRSFVAIKVDREERPDLDAVYMGAVVAMTGSGGWPMSVFLTPDGRPFYAGTYFPPRPARGMPSFPQVLEAVATAWREQRADLEAVGDRVVAALREQAAAGAGGVTGTDGVGTAEVDPGLLGRAVDALGRSFDTDHGGWGGAPKFPASMVIAYLLRQGLHEGEPGRQALAMALRTLDAMADGGIHDHLDGGLHRYATDAAWAVPHFEKMLYDNALLAAVALEAWQLTGARRYRDLARETLDWIETALATPDGAWASSTDADTGGVEGATFAWRIEEIHEALGPAESPLFEAAYGLVPIAPAGHDHGEGSALVRTAPDEAVAARLGLPLAEVERRLAEARSVLRRRRAARPQPARDDKVIAAWNGLALAAFAAAGSAFREQDDPDLVADGERYLAIATRAGESLARLLWDADGRLGRSWKDGRLTGRGILEDHAHLAHGFLALYEATADERWFAAAQRLAGAIRASFVDPAGGFFDTAVDHEALVVRPREVQDGAIPSGGAMAATVLLRLASLTGDEEGRTLATAAIARLGDLPGRHPLATGQWLIAADLLVHGIAEIAIVGEPQSPETRRLAAPARTRFHPRKVLSIGRPDRTEVPLLVGRFALDGRPTAFVCRNFACRQPVHEPEALHALLAE